MKIKTLGCINLDKNNMISMAAIFITILFNILSVEHAFPLLIILAGLLLGAAIILIDSPQEFNAIFLIFIAGFAIRILLSMFLYFAASILNKDYGFFIGDGCNYSLNGWKISRLWELGVNITRANFVSSFGSASGTVSNYDFLNAFVYSISGYSPMSLFFINCLAGSIPIIFIFIIAKNIFNREIAIVSSALCAFWPSFILWSSQNLKDPLTNFGIIGFLYFLIKLRHNLRFNTLLFLSFCLLIVYYIRTLMIIPLGIASAVYFLFCFRLPKALKISFIVFMALLTLYLLKDVIVPYLRSGILEEIDSVRTVRSYGNLAYFSEFRFTSWWSILMYMPLGFFAVWFLPFPWQGFSSSQIFAGPEILVWYILFPFFVKGACIAIKNKSKDSYLLLAAIAVFSIFLIIYEGNLGTLYRHKAVIIMLTFIFAGHSLQSRRTVNSLDAFSIEVNK